MARLANFSDLPGGVLARILVALASPEPGDSPDVHELVASQLLSRACLVCKRWRQAIYAEPTLWRSFTLRPELLDDAPFGRQAQWLAATHNLLRRVGRHVEAFSSYIFDAYEAGSACTAGGWSLPQFLRLLDPSRLRALSLHQAAWEKAAAAAVPSFTQLTALHFASRRIPPEDAAALLRPLSCLQRLRMQVHVGSEPSGVLGHLHQLTWLEFHCDRHPPARVELTQLTRLRHLGMFGGQLQAPGLAAFPALNSYDLEYVAIEDTPAVPHAMSQGGTLWLNCVWRMSHTQRQPLQPRTLNALLPPGCSALVPLTRLELSCVELPSQVAACSQLSSLACLTVCDCYTWDRDPAPADNSDSDSDGDEEAAEAAQHGISNSTLASLLQQTPQLRELSIKECLVGDPAVLNSAVLPPGLTCLSLRCNYLSAAPEGPYPPALADLDLGGNKLTCLPLQLLDCTALTRLALDANEQLVLTLADARLLLGRLPQLSRLELGAESLLAPRVHRALLEGRPDLQLSFTWGDTESEGTSSSTSSSSSSSGEDEENEEEDE